MKFWLNIQVKLLRRSNTDRDNFLNADEAKSYGIIDDILDSRDDTKDGK